jgi:hypothetical protein
MMDVERPSAYGGWPLYFKCGHCSSVLGGVWGTTFLIQRVAELARLMRSS